MLLRFGLAPFCRRRDLTARRLIGSYSSATKAIVVLIRLWAMKSCPVPIGSFLEIEPEGLIVLFCQTDAASNDTLTAYDALDVKLLQPTGSAV